MPRESPSLCLRYENFSLKMSSSSQCGKGVLDNLKN